MKADLYSPKSGKKESFTLPKSLEAKENNILLAQAIRVYEDRRHPGLSKVKTRAEVRGSTRKIYKQKGTGNARHGANTAPIFVGGGRAHGPKGVKRVLSLPHKIKKQATSAALSLKSSTDRIVVLGDIKSITKTKQAHLLVEKVMAEKSDKKITVVLAKENKGCALFFRNLKSVTLLEYDNLNAYGVFHSGILAFDSQLFPQTKKVTSKKAEPKTAKKETKK